MRTLFFVIFAFSNVYASYSDDVYASYSNDTINFIKHIKSIVSTIPFNEQSLMNISNTPITNVSKEEILDYKKHQEEYLEDLSNIENKNDFEEAETSGTRIIILFLNELFPEN